MNCPACQAPVPQDAAFCPKCASPVTSGATTASDPLLAALEKTVGSEFEIMHLLGRGGMGAVYLAREYSLDRLVAIKVLLPEATTGDNRERFKREARTAAKLTHPNIVPLHAFGEAEGMMYFVMGFVQGETLKGKLERGGKIDPDETRRILGDIAGALHYAHERGVVHRDVKPDNILIEDESGKPLLTDFGVARSVASKETLTQVGTTLGTPHYMSPEQAAGEKEIDGRSDLYSLGVVGYQMLSGRLPFEGDNVREVMVQHVTKEPVALKTLVPSLPDDLVRTIAHCLTKEPDNRVADGQSIQNAFGVASAGKEEVPEELDDALQRINAGLVFVGMGLYGAYTFLLLGAPALVAAFGGCALVGLIVFNNIDRDLKKSRLISRNWSELLYWIKKPRWWVCWWPRSLRRSDDLWDRYPKPIKSFSNAYAMVLVFGIALPPILIRIATGADFSVTGKFIGRTLSVTVLAILGWNGVRLWRWAKGLGLDSKSIQKLMGLPPPDSWFWKRPDIQRLLLPPGGEIAAVDSVSRTPTGYLQALSDAAHKLDGPRRDIAGEAASVGREILSAIEALDRQIEDLAADSDGAELARLKQKLDALGEPDQSEPENKRRMRELLRQQLEFVQGLADQLEAANDRRARLLDMLKTLWLQVANLKAQVTMQGFDSSEISQKVRAIAEDVRRYREASEETVKLLEVKE